MPNSRENPAVVLQRTIGIVNQLTPLAAQYEMIRLLPTFGASRSLRRDPQLYALLVFYQPDEAPLFLCRYSSDKLTAEWMSQKMMTKLRLPNEAGKVVPASQDKESSAEANRTLLRDLREKLYDSGVPLGMVDMVGYEIAFWFRLWVPRQCEPAAIWPAFKGLAALHLK